MEITRLEGPFGVELPGVDVAGADAELASAIRKLLLEHRLLVLRNQRLDAVQLRDLGRHFGPLDVHPFIEPVAGVPVRRSRDVQRLKRPQPKRRG